jgi:hypothetical protein
MIHIDFSIRKDCKNLQDSFGEICVKCNACGRFDKKTQKQCYLRVLKEHLKEQKEFNDWDNEPKLRKLQEENIKANIKSIRQKIKEAEKAK